METRDLSREAKVVASKKQRGPEINFDSEEQRNLVEQAATSRGLSMTAFIRSSSLKAAAEVLREDQILRLTDRDFELATSTLKNLPKPNSKLKSLLK